eukprot:5201543-Pyramimonas_sp.AAC.1
MRATTTTLSGYRMTDRRWCNHLQPESAMTPTTSQGFSSNADLHFESCRCGRKDADHRRSTGIAHAALE